MICPYCGHDAPYTWARYWRSLLSRVRCEACRKVFRLRPTKWDQRVLRVFAFMTVGVPVVLVVMFGFDVNVLGICIVSWPAGIWLDRLKEVRAVPERLR